MSVACWQRTALVEGPGKRGVVGGRKGKRTREWRDWTAKRPWKLRSVRSWCPARCVQQLDFPHAKVCFHVEVSFDTESPVAWLRAEGTLSWVFEEWREPRRHGVFLSNHPLVVARASTRGPRGTGWNLGTPLRSHCGMCGNVL